VIVLEGGGINYVVKGRTVYDMAECTSMVEGPKELRDLVQEVFDERAQAASLLPEEIETGVVELRRLFREIRERTTTTPPLSIVVLPFTNLSDDSEQQYFADGITDDLTTDLSRIPHMLVIARNTAFTYRARSVSARQIGQELGVRYLLEGSVRRLGNLVRVNAQLIDADTNEHLWAEQFDREIGELFVLQNEITSRIAVALNLELIVPAAPPTPSVAWPPTHRLVYEAVLRPGAYWLRVENLTFRVTLGKARRTSRIVVETARNLLTADPGAWVPLVTRGAPPQVWGRPARDRRQNRRKNPSQIGITQGSASGTVIADDTGEEPRILVEIHDFPAEQSVPVMEVCEETAEQGSGELMRVDPEIFPERLPTGPGRPRT
jgi:TolB-like protein